MSVLDKYFSFTTSSIQPGYKKYCKRDNYSFGISWEIREDEIVDEYRILTNNTNQFTTTNTTSVVLEGEYNIPMEIRVWAINCAGPSTHCSPSLEWIPSTDDVLCARSELDVRDAHKFLAPSSSPIAGGCHAITTVGVLGLFILRLT